MGKKILDLKNQIATLEIIISASEQAKYYQQYLDTEEKEK